MSINLLNSDYLLRINNESFKRIFFLKNKAKQNDMMIVSALIFIIVHIK